MNPLETRKQLLIAESELNREQLVREWQAMGADVHSLARRARTIGSVAAAAAALVAGVASLRRKPSVDTGVKPSWGQTILKGAGLLSTVWLAFRPAGHDPKNQ